MEIKSRSLNMQEGYACRPKDTKNVFSTDDNLFISFGYLNRNFSFDRKFVKRPNIKGSIICSLSINRRLNVFDSRPILSFYVIKDQRYSNKNIEEFLESILPQMCEWYHKTLSKSETSIPGVEVLLIEWTGNGFKVHDCRFA